MDLLRFITSGSVDDGKSTLIGRLLYDAHAVYEDQLQAMRKASRKARLADGMPDLAILTDGLRAEREQGITIDVAYKYFATSRRKFIIADTPGHVQYTRNMVTGASNSDLAIILIDARRGVVEQTRRHACIAKLLGIPHLVVAVNKMDMAGYDEEVFYRIATAFKPLTSETSFQSIHFIPISALHGDNVVSGSEHMPWYAGSPLLTYLEELPLEAHKPWQAARMPVQWVIRPQSEDLHDYRGYAGQVTGGALHIGDTVQVWPSGIETHIKSIELGGQVLREAHHGQSVVIQLADQLDVSRGDLIASAAHPPALSHRLRAQICWMDDHKTLRPGARMLLQHQSRRLRCMVERLAEKIDIHSLQSIPAEYAALNDIATVDIRLASPLAFDPYQQNRHTGAFILLDEVTGQTLAGGMIQHALDE